ncbi:unnamed protein product [Chrysoparadoxa australica]
MGGSDMASEVKSGPGEDAHEHEVNEGRVTWSRSRQQEGQQLDGVTSVYEGEQSSSRGPYTSAPSLQPEDDQNPARPQEDVPLVAVKAYGSTSEAAGGGGDGGEVATVPATPPMTSTPPMNFAPKGLTSEVITQGNLVIGEAEEAVSHAGTAQVRLTALPAAAWQCVRAIKIEYLEVKALYFLFYGSLGALMPYLPVYYHSLGISDRRIGHLGAITPAVTFLVSPAWGALTDHTGRLKQILLFTFISSVLCRLLLVMRESFSWIVGVVALAALVNAPVRPLIDSSVLSMLTDRKEYGKQRLWGQWGFGVGSFLVGPMLTKSSHGYQSAFYAHAAISVPTLAILCMFNPRPKAAAEPGKGGAGEVQVEEKKPPPQLKKGLALLAHDGSALAFFTLIFAIGLSSGVIENFAYKRLRELGGGGGVMGLSRLVSSLAGIPMFYFSGSLSRKFSIFTVLLAAMFSYIMRFCIYATVQNPWHALPAEALRGVTFAGMWAASTFHAHEIAPPGMSTTLLGILNGVYGGIGQSLGSLIGGALSNALGTAHAFLVYASVDAVLLVVFLLYRHAHGVRNARRLKERKLNQE